jgi:dipeptidyl aminopeptidase/acylaminoacyl peptidase
MKQLRLVAAVGIVCALAVPLAAQKKGAPAPAGPPRKEMGALVIDGIPDIPARIPERIFQYQNARGAGVFDWALDGKGMLVGTRFAATTQVHWVTAPGGDRQQLTFFEDAVSGAFFDEKKGQDGFYFVKDVGGNERTQLWWFDRKNGKSTMITDGTSRNESFRVADGGGRIAFVSTARNNTDFDVYLKDGDAPAKLLKETKGQWAVADWSPDGTRLLLHNFISINESYLWVLEVAGGKMTEVNPQNGAKKISYGGAVFSAKADVVFYTSDEDSEFQRLVSHDLKSGKKTVLTPQLKWDVEGLDVSRNGKLLAYTVNEGGRHALYVANAAAPGKARKVALPAGLIGGIEFDRQSKRLAVSMSAATGPSDVYVVDPGSLKVTQWTFSEVGGLDRGTFVEPTLVEFESFDKLKVPAWVYRPRNVGQKKLPVVVSIHGGPEGQAQVGFNWFIQYLVNELGVVVIEPNVRGSAGYGKSYLLLDNGFKREDSVKDIGALLDWIAKQPDMDAKRVAVYGGSYGGFMVLATMVMYNDRIKCGVDVVGISHFVTFLNNTEDYRRDLRRAEYGDERDPKMKDFLHSISPLTNAKKIKAPLFVIQGANDPRVPWSEAEQIVKTVRSVGGAVWYLLAKDEGHGFRKKPNRDYMTNAITLFFEEYLLK